MNRNIVQSLNFSLAGAGSSFRLKTVKSSGSLEMAISGNNAAVAALTCVQRMGERRGRSLVCVEFVSDEWRGYQRYGRTSRGTS